MFEMRKHYGGYFKGLRDFKQFRIPMVNTTSLSEMQELLNRVEEFYQE